MQFFTDIQDNSACVPTVGHTFCEIGMAIQHPTELKHYVTD